MVNETMVDEYNEKRIQELEAINAELLEALEDCKNTLMRLRERGTIGDSPSIRLACTAIAKAKGAAR